MTSTLVASLFRKGRQVFQGILKTKAQNVGVKVANINKTTNHLETVHSVVRYQSALTPSRINSVWKKVLPNVYFRSLARDLGHQAAWRRARNIPLLSFVGLVLASHSDEEDNTIANRIHDFVTKVDNISTSSTLLQKVQELSLDHFEFGQSIGQGCNAVVYEACFKHEESVCEEPAVVAENEETDITSTDSGSLDDGADGESDITVLSDPDEEVTEAVDHPEEEFVDNHSDSDSDIMVLSITESEQDDYDKVPLIFHVSDDDHDDRMNDFDDESDVSIISWSDLDDDDVGDGLDDAVHQDSLSEDLEEPNDDLATYQNHFPGINTEMSVEAFKASETVTSDTVEQQMYNSLNSDGTEAGKQYNLAVKMMFNYGESNADSILREMEREAVPARLAQTHIQMLPWQNGNKVRKKNLPPHSNIVEMWGMFVDSVPCLPDCLLEYPAALPARINPNGIGRNKTLFLVMKKYQYTLGEYLSTFKLSLRERLILLGQLLEAVAHMRRYDIAHRDLKLDNIFLDISTGVVPQLVVGDFGSCLADNEHGLQLPYPTDQIDRGGNAALMAPEIATAEPGRSKYLDYRKSDLWATGALAYQILGAYNPFYTNENNRRLDSRTYRMSDLPPLPDDVPELVKDLIVSTLHREPSERPSARFAANVIQLMLWAPSQWLLANNSVNRNEIIWWLVTMATEVRMGTRTPERMMKGNFLQNLSISDLKSALGYLGIKL